MSVRDNILAGKYRNKKFYNPPSSELENIDPENMTGKQIREAKERNLEIKKRYNNEYRLHDIRLKELFCQDLEEENGVKGHPKADKIWSLAWKYVNSSELDAVVNYYEDFVDLIK